MAGTTRLCVLGLLIVPLPGFPSPEYDGHRSHLKEELLRSKLVIQSPGQK